MCLFYKGLGMNFGLKNGVFLPSGAFWREVLANPVSGPCQIRTYEGAVANGLRFGGVTTVIFPKKTEKN